MKTLELTDQEAYILGCVLGYLCFTGGDVNSLLNKVYELQDKELDEEDFDKVSFRVDIKANEVEEVVIGFN